MFGPRDLAATKFAKRELSTFKNFFVVGNTNTREFSARHSELSNLATRTGGRVFYSISKSEADEGLALIEKELMTSYEFVFSPNGNEKVAKATELSSVIGQNGAKSHSANLTVRSPFGYFLN
jgi:hypothetical protein